MKLLLAILLVLLPLSAQATHGHHHHHGKHHYEKVKNVDRFYPPVSDAARSTPACLMSLDCSNVSLELDTFSKTKTSERHHASERKVMHSENSALERNHRQRDTRPRSAHLPAGAVALFEEDWKAFLRERDLYAIFREFKFGDAFAAAGGKP